MSEKKPDLELIWRRYASGVDFNSRLDLEREVETNENFFIGKQWEGVNANGLPTPVFNFLKRVTLFTVASVTTDNLKLNAAPIGSRADRGELYRLTNIINREFEAVFEHNDIGSLLREYMRNAAVDGDGCIYTRWDPELETGQAARGGIVSEIVENTRVYFSDPNERRVQKQSWIVISRREAAEELRARAKDAGVRDWESIRPDAEERSGLGAPKALTDGKATVLLYFYRDRSTGHICCVECTRDVELSRCDMGITLFPITWLNWDYRQDNYHGQSLISGLIPNQIFINKLFAMSMISLMTTAYPKIVYDKTRIDRWDNRVGAAIGVNGGDVASVARIIDPAQISPQIAQFIELAVNYTQTFLGATPAALGDVRPDNTSAILALQRASSTPSELTKQNLYRSVEELGRIYLEFMAEYYGVRSVSAPMPRDIPEELSEFTGIRPGDEAECSFDFGVLRSCPMGIKLDVGASAYWSEIASMQTLDNLLMQGKIDVLDYLERVPDGYISRRQELLEKLKAAAGDGDGRSGRMRAPGGAADMAGMGGMAGIADMSGAADMAGMANMAGVDAAAALAGAGGASAPQGDGVPGGIDASGGSAVPGAASGLAALAALAGAPGDGAASGQGGMPVPGGMGAGAHGAGTVPGADGAAAPGDGVRAGAHAYVHGGAALSRISGGRAGAQKAKAKKAAEEKEKAEKARAEKAAAEKEKAKKTAARGGKESRHG